MMFKSILSAAVLVSSALASIAFNNAPFSIESGKSYTVTWTATGTGPVTVQLRQGPSTNLLPVADLTTSGSGGSLTFTAPSLPSGSDYAFFISQGTDINFWGPISLVGTAASASPASSTPPASSPPASISSGSAIPSHVSSYPVIPSQSSNSTKTITAPTTSKAPTSLSTSKVPTPSVTNVPSTGGAAQFGSPVALVLCAIAAMFYLQ